MPDKKALIGFNLAPPPPLIPEYQSSQTFPYLLILTRCGTLGSFIIMDTQVVNIHSAVCRGLNPTK